MGNPPALPGDPRRPHRKVISISSFEEPKICSCSGGRVHKGKTCDPYCPGSSGRARNFSGQNFWARGYFVSTVGRDEKVIQEYIRRQEQEDQRLEQLKLVTE